MSFTGYIVPSDLLLSSPPRDGWHATPVPSDPTKSLVVVRWDNPNFEVEFESLPGVLPLGHPWEPLPTEAATLLASFQPTPTAPAAARLAPATALPVTDVPATPESVAGALRKVEWHGARLVR
jgi:hypothetical protein